MSEQAAPKAAAVAPILPDWTIEQLLQWFAEDDARLSDGSLRALLCALEESLTGRRWTREEGAVRDGTRIADEPTIVSLVRSIARQVRLHPALRARTLSGLAAASPDSAPARPVLAGA